MSDRIIPMHTLACDWTGCEETAADDLADSCGTYKEAIERWAYLPQELVSEWKNDDWLHDPDTGRDYCPKHWHWDKTDSTRVPGPEEES